MTLYLIFCDHPDQKKNKQNDVFFDILHPNTSYEFLNYWNISNKNLPNILHYLELISLELLRMWSAGIS